LESTDLECFRKLLVRQRDELLRKSLSIFSDLREKENNLKDPLDMAADYTQQSCALQICDRENQLLKKVSKALERIQSRGYGICENCGEKILPAPLKIRPVTMHCMECKTIDEHRGKTTFILHK
jgi:DnaK suppressor protein